MTPTTLIQRAEQMLAEQRPVWHYWQNIDPLIRDLLSHIKAQENSVPVAKIVEIDGVHVLQWMDCANAKVGPLFAHPPQPAEPSNEVIENARATLQDIAGANYKSWGVGPDEFVDWARNRARFELEKMASYRAAFGGRDTTVKESLSVSRAPTVDELETMLKEDDNGA